MRGIVEDLCCVAGHGQAKSLNHSIVKWENAGNRSQSATNHCSQRGRSGEVREARSMLLHKNSAQEADGTDAIGGYLRLANFRSSNVATTSLISWANGSDRRANVSTR